MMHDFGPFYGPVGYSGWGWAGMIVGLVIFLVLLAAFIWFIVWALRRSRGGGYGYRYPQAPGGSSAREIVQARYAKGEITRDEYLKLLEDLGER
ncbi:MAG: SHOCT domain-containing protein [Anaerolineae bacterium]